MILQESSGKAAAAGSDEEPQSNLKGEVLNITVSIHTYPLFVIKLINISDVDHTFDSPPPPHKKGIA